MKISVETTESGFLILPTESGKDTISVKNQWFTPEFWSSRQCLVGESSGRNTTWFIRPNSKILTSQSAQSDWVLRHYYRGGMVAKVSRDKFFFTGIHRTRPYQELKLLINMRQLGLPVPEGVAARVVKTGLTYSADLLMQKLAAQDLVQCLCQGPLSQTQWSAVGTTIAQFHNQGVYHADLNAHNIMIDQQQKVWLIDFDRCRIKKPQSKWQQQNLDRLLRSLVKEKGLNTSFEFEQQCWQWLTQGYHAHLSNAG